MSMAHIKPELWAQEIILTLKKMLPAASVCNTNLAGDITKKGDKLHIIGAGSVSTAAYPDSENITYADPSDTDTELEIDIDQYFAIKVEDKDRKQAAVSWEQIYAGQGAYKLKDDIDTQIMLEYANAGLDSYETGTTPWQWGAAGADVPKFFAALHKQLDDAKAPRVGRYVILPSIAIQALTLYASSRNTNWGDQVTLNGFAGNMFGFEVFMSANCYTESSVVHGLAGVKGYGMAFAQQINPDDIESLRLEGRFATGVRGRVLAGVATYQSGIMVDINLNTTLLA